MTTPDSEPVVLTVGHATRPLAEFIALLKAHSVIRPNTHGWFPSSHRV